MPYINTLSALLLIACTQMLAYFIRHSLSMDDSIIGKLEQLVELLCNVASIILLVMLIIRFL